MTWLAWIDNIMYNYYLKGKSLFQVIPLLAQWKTAKPGFKSSIEPLWLNLLTPTNLKNFMKQLTQTRRERLGPFSISKETPKAYISC